MIDVKKRRSEQLTGKLLERAIAEACDGLVYISETDAPIEPVLFRSPKKKTPLEAVAGELGTKTGDLDLQPVDTFFDKLTRSRDWHGEKERKRVRSFRKLRDTLGANLNELSVIRAGKIRIRIFVVGFDADMNVAGIATTAVET